MILLFVVAEATRNPAITAVSILFAVSHVMFAAHYRFRMQSMVSDSVSTIIGFHIIDLYHSTLFRSLTRRKH